MQIVSRQKILQIYAKLTLSNLFKSLAIFGVILYLIPQFRCFHSSNEKPHYRPSSTLSSTNITHVVFGIASSSKTWESRRSYVEAWWKPNISRGFIFLEKIRNEFLPWPHSCPPCYISEDMSRYKRYNHHKTKQAIRMVRTLVEMFRAENEGVRWYIMMDDDTLIFLDNLESLLAKYDHTKYYYIGANSESIASNSIFSFDMAFGGGGYALSYPLVEALVENMDECIKRYPNLYGSDHMIQSCVADLGVSLTQEKGFHQIDLHGDISGYLSAHPQSPLLSLHHLEAVDPLFPSMDRNESFRHLITAAKIDESRLFQQTICYFKQENWTLSLSWGYSAQIYHGFHPPSYLLKPLETFLPWSKFARPPFMFNTRIPTKDLCETPHIFFFDSVEKTIGNYRVTRYNRNEPRRSPSCTSYNSTTNVANIRVMTPLSRFDQVGIRRECCDIVKKASMDNEVEVKLRNCFEDEFLA